MSEPKQRETQHERNRRLARRTANQWMEDVKKGARDPFQFALATALAGGPSQRDWRKLAREKPHLWAGAVQKLAEPAGYVPRSMSVQVSAEASDVAGELVRRFGGDSARQMLEAAGLPASLLSPIIRTDTDGTLEGEAERVEAAPGDAPGEADAPES